jgi:hypothetical protein
MFIDRVLVEAFAMAGRGTVIAMGYRAGALTSSSVHLLGLDEGEEHLKNFTAWNKL